MEGFRFPLPYAQKSPPPAGATGYSAPDIASVEAWEDTALTEGGNVGFRLSKGIIGIDIDNHVLENGYHTLEKLGITLPRTLAVSAQNDPGKEGITLLYRVPEGLDEHFLAGSNAGIDRISNNLRYLVVPPSVHPSGEPYRWLQASYFKGGIHWNSVHGDILDDFDAVLGLISEIDMHSLTSIFPLRDAGRGLEPADLSAASACRVVKGTVLRGTQMMRMNEGSRHNMLLKTTTAVAGVVSKGHVGTGYARKMFKQVWDAQAGDADRSKEFMQVWDSAFRGVKEGTTCRVCRSVRGSSRAKAPKRLRKLF